MAPKPQMSLAVLTLGHSGGAHAKLPASSMPLFAVVACPESPRMMSGKGLCLDGIEPRKMLFGLMS